MIYWFTGQPSSGKTTLGNKLYKFLKTEKRNWRRDVFHIDGDDLRKLTVNKDYSDKGRETNIRNAQMIAEYAHNNGCDVVVSVDAPFIVNFTVCELLFSKIVPVPDSLGFNICPSAKACADTLAPAA